MPIRQHCGSRHVLLILSFKVEDLPCWNPDTHKELSDEHKKGVDNALPDSISRPQLNKRYCEADTSEKQRRQHILECIQEVAFERMYKSRALVPLPLSFFSTQNDKWPFRMLAR